MFPTTKGALDERVCLPPRTGQRTCGGPLMNRALYSRGLTTQRTFDVMCAATGLLLLSPLFAVVTLLILVSDGRPILFSQLRTGRHGTQFRIWKFRTMRAGVTGN